jgi:predicted nucleotidyltransferase
MATSVQHLDWSVSEEKVAAAVRRIVEFADPLQVIAFGSRARGNARANSDLDLAVIVDEQRPRLAGDLYAGALRDVAMEVDLVVVSKAEYDLHRPWVNSVFNYIDREGIVLYDRDHPQSARPEAIRLVGAGRVGAAPSAA